MKDVLFLAWRSVLYFRAKSIILITCLVIIIALPIFLNVIMKECELQLLSRAHNTPLIVGAKGSSIDLSMNSLYFSNDLPELIDNKSMEQINNSDLAESIPLYARFSARDYPVVGTNINYFKVRNLDLQYGRKFTILGECVLGAKVAEKLNLHVGDHIITSPESVFDLAGIYPLKMKIVGVLNTSHTFDDIAVFVDIKTTWIIQGLGHGHQDVTTIKDPSLVYQSKDSVVTATAKLLQYNEINEENLYSFHFHGDLSDYPLTSVLVFPKDKKSETLLRGRFVANDLNIQLVQPKAVIGKLLENIFKIRALLDTFIGVVAITTFLACLLIFYLSLKLRANELKTLFKLGCHSTTIKKLLAMEVLIISGFSIVICSFVWVIIQVFKEEIVIKVIEQL